MVAVRHVRLLGGQRRDDVAQRAQRLVDGLRLLHLLARRARLLDAAQGGSGGQGQGRVSGPQGTWAALCTMQQQGERQQSCCPGHRPPAQGAAAHRSEPARSTNDSLPRATLCVCRLVASMHTVMMRCEREDSRFICGWVGGPRGGRVGEEGRLRQREFRGPLPLLQASSKPGNKPSARHSSSGSPHPTTARGAHLRGRGAAARQAAVDDVHELARRRDVVHHSGARHRHHALGVLLDLQLGRLVLQWGRWRGGGGGRR